MRTLWAIAALLIVQATLAQQVVDPDFKPVVANPAYAPNRGPRVGIDEAHGNFHTAAGRYKPFADLLRTDGYIVQASARSFEAGALKELDILVIANAESSGEALSAFTESECDAIENWVRDGGSLLLIADHAPFGAAAAKLGMRFDIDMAKAGSFIPAETASPRN